MRAGILGFVLALLVTASFAAVACSNDAPQAPDASPIDLGDTEVVIGDGVIEAIERDGEADVLISTKLRRVLQVLSVLDESDFTLKREFDRAVSGVLTRSGLQKLANHPDVVGIDLNCCVTTQ